MTRTERATLALSTLGLATIGILTATADTSHDTYQPQAAQTAPCFFDLDCDLEGIIAERGAAVVGSATT